VAFVDVSVVPMDRERLLEHQTVVVRDGRVVALLARDGADELLANLTALAEADDIETVRQAILAAIDPVEVMQAVMGEDTTAYNAPVGTFLPGTPSASTAGMDRLGGKKSIEEIKAMLAAAGYSGEKVVLLHPTDQPFYDAMTQVVAATLQKIGVTVDDQSMDFGTVVQRRASKEPIDKGGWNIFYTWLGGFSNISPAPNNAIRGNGTAAWFGWPDNAKMEALYDSWFDAPDLDAQQKICEAMQIAFWQNPSYAPLGMYDQPTAFHNYLQDVPDGWPQFYGLKKVI